MGKRILIVDDAKFARMVLIKALNNNGYTDIIEAATAAEAKSIFAAEMPALTILDITLADLTLLNELLALRPQAKIVMNSAIGQPLIIADALEAGAVNFITKPTDGTVLLEIVHSILDECE